MKSTATPDRRRRTTAKSTSTKASSPSRSRAVAPLVEQGAAIAETVQNSRFSALARFAPSIVVAVGGYARRKPVKAAGLALGLGGLLYLSRTLWAKDPAAPASRTTRKAARRAAPAAAAA
jgi:hypothetical protein